MTPPVNHPFFLGLRLLLKTLVRAWLRISRGLAVLGREHLPARRRGCMLIANHAAFIDSVYIIAAVRPRFTICGAKPKYFEKPLSGFLFRTANIMKVTGEDQFLADCVRLLAAGEAILIYPEMGRNPAGMGPFTTWAARVALESGAPVIPLYLYGTTQGDTGRKTLAAGPPFTPSGDREAVTAEFRRRILACRELVRPPEVKGRTQ
ncbi:1-acyl-sn-glycerol-3-phosphate acyltransferase [bacterium]|nr:1-acyl-sn-glycerol-3-phosphate acyltransferase [bacterium]